MDHENLNVYNYITSDSDSSSSVVINLFFTLKLIFGNSLNDKYNYYNNHLLSLNFL